MISLGFLFAGLILCHSISLTKSFQLASATVSTWRLWWIRSLLMGALYDNYVLFLSSMFDANRLFSLHPPRYLFHSLILPFLVPYTYSCIHDSSARANTTFSKILIPVFVLVVLWNFYHEYVHLDLELTTLTDPYGYWTDFQRWVKTSSQPPMVTVIANAVAVIGGLIIYVKTQWLFWGSISILVVNGAFIGHPYALILGNVMEVIFAYSLLATEYHLHHSRPNRTKTL